MFRPSEESKRAAYDLQQMTLAGRKSDTRARMAEARDRAIAAGDAEMAEFWAEYLDDLG